MDATELTQRLERRAGEAGFDAVGVAAAGRLERDGKALQAWLGAGRQAGMRWMERDPGRRSDPRELLPGCRSVVTLAMNYRPPGELGTPRDAARVALYAQGRDYHRVMGRKLRRLAEWLQEISGHAARSFVDTGPVLERAWAERSGIGWIGKNANLISRELGSWLLLGEILSAAALLPSPGPHGEFCGSCTACLDACPTDAFPQPGVVDARRCISYWTIEHRGAIPEESRRGLGDWIFGCDICQEVCPWNLSFAKPARHDPLERREDLRGLEPEQVLALDEAAFRERYSGTPLMRAKWEGMRRNACVVLGNRRSRKALPVLRRALADADRVVRECATWAIRVIGERESEAEEDL
jgi:epoxyqueuosine reductase